MKKIIEIDTDLVQIVPIDPTNKMMDKAFDNISLSDAHADNGVTEHIWDYMLRHVPKNLPGVVEIEPINTTKQIKAKHHTSKVSVATLALEGGKEPSNEPCAWILIPTKQLLAIEPTSRSRPTFSIAGLPNEFWNIGSPLYRYEK